MGNISNYESTEIGKERMLTLRVFGDDVKRIIDQIYQLSSSYEAYRSKLDPEADLGDIEYSDASLDYSVAEVKPTLDMLTPEEKVWLDKFMDGLGYKVKEAEEV